MLTKNDIKRIKSLSLKKYRDECREFVAEGPKIVRELLAVYECRLLLSALKDGLENWTGNILRKESVTERELCQCSQLKNPQSVLAVFSYPVEKHNHEEENYADRELCLALENVQDPGNLGTIIRLADWFGIRHIYCSRQTADAYAPKVVQATMGAVARVRMHYCDLMKLINGCKEETPIYGTFLEGENIYEANLSDKGLVIMGNEGNGISFELEKLVTSKLHIPSFALNGMTSESLNVAVASAIVCSEFRRKRFVAK